MFNLFRVKRRKNNLISFNPDGTPVEDKSYRDLIACSIMITLKVMQHSFYLKEKVAKKIWTLREPIPRDSKPSL